MDRHEANEIVDKYEGAVKSGAYVDWNLETLQGVQKQLREARAARIQWGSLVEPCEAVLEKINRAIELRQLEKQSSEQHQQAMTLSGQTLTVSRKGLWWARVAGIAAVIVTVGFLLKDTPLSKLLPSTSFRPAPEPSPQASATVAPSAAPTAAESPSESPPASATPSVTATPE